MDLSILMVFRNHSKLEHLQTTLNSIDNLELVSEIVICNESEIPLKIDFPKTRIITIKKLESWNPFFNQLFYAKHFTSGNKILIQDIEVCHHNGIVQESQKDNTDLLFFPSFFLMYNICYTKSLNVTHMLHCIDSNSDGGWLSILDRKFVNESFAFCISRKSLNKLDFSTYGDLYGMKQRLNFLNLKIENSRNSITVIQANPDNPKINKFKIISPKNIDTRKTKLAIVVAAYKIDEQRITDFLKFNSTVFNQHNVKVVIVTDKHINTKAYPNLNCVIYPENLEQFSLSKTTNFGLWQIKEESIIIKTDIDILFTSKILTQIKEKVRNGAGFAAICAQLGDPSKLGSTCAQWKNLRKIDDGFGACFALMKSDWVKLNGYNENLFGWGAEDVDMRIRASKDLFLEISDEYEIFHLQHKTRTSPGNKFYFKRNIQNLALSKETEWTIFKTATESREKSQKIVFKNELQLLKPECVILKHGFIDLAQFSNHFKGCVEFSGSLDNFKAYLQNNPSLKYFLHANPLAPRTKDYREIAVEKGITSYCIERGALNNTCFLDPNGFNFESNSYNIYYWDKELNNRERVEIEEYISQCKLDDSALEIQPKKMTKNRLLENCHIKPGQKVIFVPLQVPKDTVIKYYSDWVKDMRAFVEICDNIALQNPKWKVILKKHPLDKTGYRVRKCTFVDANFKDLLDIADIVLTINGGVGLNAMMWEKPVILCGDCFYQFSDINMKANNFNDIINFIKNPMLPNYEKILRFLHYLKFKFYSDVEFVRDNRGGTASVIWKNFKTIQPWPF
jgi:hypothetical protein